LLSDVRVVICAEPLPFYFTTRTELDAPRNRLRLPLAARGAEEAEDAVGGVVVGLRLAREISPELVPVLSPPVRVEGEHLPRHQLPPLAHRSSSTRAATCTFA